MIQRKGEHDVFIGTQHRRKGDDAQEACNQAGNVGFVIAVTDTRVTEDDDKKGRYTSGCVMIAVVMHIASVVAQNGGEIDGGEENQGGIARTQGSC